MLAPFILFSCVLPISKRNMKFLVWLIPLLTAASLDYYATQDPIRFRTGNFL